MSLVEIIPNVSEGRRADVIRAMEHAFTLDPVVALLDTHTDPSHHRSVLTAVAPLTAVTEASLRLAEAAVRHVDLRSHRGVHPRIGALDVLPLVPLGPTPRREVVELAATVGASLAERLELPVFLYGEAARTGVRRLADLRRGGSEGLSQRMATRELVPDFGPSHAHPTAGAVAVGVRDFLIAYNVELQSSDVRPARNIARTLRTSSGGLPGVQALGLELPHRGHTQVSMNVLDFRASPLSKVFGTVRDEARALGIDVVRSEIVGLIPEAAYFEGMQEYLLLDTPPKVLEEKLRGLV